MDIEKTAAAFLKRRANLEGRRRMTCLNEKEYREAVFTSQKDLQNAVIVLHESGFFVTGEGKNILYGPLLSELSGVEDKTILTLCDAGWTAVDTICPRRAKLAFLIE